RALPGGAVAQGGGADREYASPGSDQPEKPESRAGRGAGGRVLAPAHPAGGRDGCRMLMMSRREGETILIGDDIEIVITHIGRTKVRVGIRAPRETPVI